MSNALTRWMQIATPAEKKALAAGAKTRLNYLQQMTVRGTKRRLSADLAIKVEASAARLAKRNPKLPELRREDLASACRGCEFARRCRG